MKILCLHCRRFSYRFDHPTSYAEQGDVGDSDSFEDALVALVGVEPGDGPKVGAVAKELRKLTRRAGAGSIVLNPFSHLTSTPASPAEAREVGSGLRARLEESSPTPVGYASFGWYKSFVADVLGHERSQVFRSF